VYQSRIEGDPFAIQMNTEIIREMSEAWKVRKEVTGNREIIVFPNELTSELMKWISNLKISYDDKITICGKNFGSFDLQFLKELNGWEVWTKAAHVSHRYMDPGPLFARCTDAVPPDLATCLQRAGLPDQVSHRAIDDANAVLTLLESQKQLFIGDMDREMVEYLGEVKNVTTGPGYKDLVLYQKDNYRYVVDGTTFYNSFKPLAMG